MESSSSGALNRQLLDMVHDMQNEGLLDQQFGLIHSLRETTSPFFIAELIPIFCTDVQAVLRDMTRALDQPVLDYHDLEEYCIKLKGSTSCIGAHRMALACVDLRQAIDNKSKEGCLLALNGLRHEFHNLRGRLDKIVQLEKKIVSQESGQLPCE
ncbi:histidine-containing phosphotransfer protein 2-like isoform X2 [Malania oleifera]|uniref:histidine-containing phosphotransfer protein 2-like isoform X2 n=1 Tax=Malania oleifera TaxID=397392 RepID=UPI0025ADC4F2|nr:histidine-containing phosphotransfer protein 2-like isoform X2 [Malania oleifera]